MLLDALGQQVRNLDISGGVTVELTLYTADASMDGIASSQAQAQAASTVHLSSHLFREDGFCDLADTPQVLRWPAYQVRGQRVFAAKMMLMARIKGVLEVGPLGAATVTLDRLPCKPGSMFDAKASVCRPCGQHAYVVDPDRHECQQCPVSSRICML
jgi:hypothetical protein